jgi:DNA-binding CsgD family transcriptional regulator
VLADLTPQQRQIVILASRGLTNGEIADRLFLSPRTVAYHLYNSYPKLGIAGRHQLRDLIDQATDLAAAPPVSGQAADQSQSPVSRNRNATHLTSG